ncbi:MAG: FHA domain-containing protein, partial [Dehalococcoidia bacterium]|nr:FHA domain-containing protein [Dehalococcoidia bacterium]
MTQVSVGRLRVTGPAGEQAEFALSDEPVLLGRDAACGIVLANPGVSRRHARLVVRDGALHIEDLGSLNGVYVNDLRLAAHQPFALRDGDRLEIGPYTLVFVAARPASPPSPSVVATMTALSEPPASDPRTVLASRQPTIVVYHGATVREYPLSGDRVTIGRGVTNTITVDDPTVSREHAVIQRTPDGWQILDVGSGYGVYQHGQRVAVAPLRHQDSVRIGQDVQLVFLIDADTSAPVGTPQGLDLGARDAITIGRDSTNDLVLENPQVSRRHARIERRGAELVVIDLGSTNGTFVNGARVSQAT